MVQTGALETWPVLEKRKTGVFSSAGFKQQIPRDAPRDGQKIALG